MDMRRLVLPFLAAVLYFVVASGEQINTPRTPTEKKQPNNYYSASQAQPNNSEPLNIIILLVDGLRADHLGCYGYSRNTSPNIDRIAKDAVNFAQTISQSQLFHPKTRHSEIF